MLKLEFILNLIFKNKENDAEQQAFEKAHPALIRFVKGRFDPRAKYGLSLTLGLLTTFAFVYLFFGILQDVIGRESIHDTDIYILNQIAKFRSPELTNFMLFITTLGKGAVIAFGVFLLSNIFIFKNWGNYLVTLLFSVIFGQLIFVEFIKFLVKRARPESIYAIVSENSYSFPSGHTFVAVSFYGLLTIFLYQHLKTRKMRLLISLAGIMLIFLIGLSRVYLGVHYPTDVLASLAVGGSWLTAITTAFFLFEKSAKRDRRPLDFHEIIGLLSFIFIAIWIIAVIYFYQQQRF